MDDRRGLERRLLSARALAAAATMAASRQELIHLAVNQVEDVIPCDRAGWSDVDLINGIVRITLDQRESLPGLPAVHDHGALPLPMVTRYEQRRVLPATRLSDIVDHRWNRSASYNYLYRAMGVDHQLGIGTDDGPGFVAGVALNRSSIDFSDNDVLLLDLIRPAIRSALRRITKQEQLAAVLAFFGPGHHLVTLDPVALTPIEIDRPAADLLDAGDLGLEGAEGRSRLGALLDNLPAGGQAVCNGITLLRLTRPGESRLIVAVRPSSMPIDRLTARQRQILGYANSGLPAKAIASTLRTSPRTVEKHLHDAYARLGVTNRLEALRAVRDTGVSILPFVQEGATVDSTPDSTDQRVRPPVTPGAAQPAAASGRRDTLIRRLRWAADLADAATMAESQAELAAILVNNIAEVVNCDRVGWNDADLAAGIVSVQLDGGGPDGDEVAILSHRVLPLPLMSWYENQQRLTATRLSDVVGTGWRQTATYWELYRPSQVEHQLGVGVAGDRFFLSALALNRSSKDFTDLEVFIADLISASASSAYRRIIAQERVTAVLRTFGHGYTIASLHADSLAPLELDPCAAALLADARLTPLTAEGRRNLRDLLNADPPGHVQLHHGVAVLRVPGPTDTSVVLAVQSAPPGAEELTSRQREILALVRTGLTTLAVAKHLRLSPRTVDKHLQHVYERLGVTNAVEATRVLDLIAGPSRSTRDVPDLRERQ